MYETMCRELLFHAGKTRLSYILDHVRDNTCDLVALTETWLSPDIAKYASVVQECADYG